MSKHCYEDLSREPQVRGDQLGVLPVARRVEESTTSPPPPPPPTAVDVDWKYDVYVEFPPPAPPPPPVDTY